MFGKNPQRPAINGDGNQLDLVAIFATIQGEGPRQGQAAIFIRLGGCNLACKFCDTEFENFQPASLDNIIAEVKKLHTKQNLIIITGGEPFRQPIAPLCQRLLDLGFIVQIETNGTMWRDIPQEVEIVCSPKIGTQIRAEIAQRVTAYKYLVSDYREKYMNLPADMPNKPIYLQPIDEYDNAKTAQNLKKASKLALQNGYNISIQLHKLLEVE